jgi:hypothetical protein
MVNTFDPAAVFNARATAVASVTVVYEPTGRLMVTGVPPVVYTKLASCADTLYHACGICALSSVRLVTFWRGVDNSKRAFARSPMFVLSRESICNRTIVSAFINQTRTKKGKIM